MGNNTIPVRANSQVIDETWFNILISVMSGDLTPRLGNAASANAGSLGNPALPFLRAAISAGYWAAGDYKYHNSYNGLCPAGEGWMLCDGRQITLANYDAEHGAGHFATFITGAGGGTPILNKFLPNFSTAQGRYAVGSPTTPQDGSIAITPVGNTAHSAPIAFGAGTAINTSTAVPTVPVTVNTQLGNHNNNIQPDSIAVQVYMRII